MSRIVKIELEYGGIDAFNNEEEYLIYKRDFGIDKISMESDIIEMSDVEFDILLKSGNIIIEESFYSIIKKTYKIKGDRNSWVLYLRNVDHFDYEDLPF